ncbi:MAG: serine hydrolase domain-containing protein [Caldilineaceae bacterium]
MPELANRQVLKRFNGPLHETVPANRAITLRDLLTLRMGFGYATDLAMDSPIWQAMGERHLAIGPSPTTAPSIDVWMKALGSLPLMAQPGERWMYETGSDVLGVLVARAAGQPLGDFMRERIFAPLGMKDTAFFVPPEKLDRLPPCYQPNEDGGLEIFDAASGHWSQPPAFPAGGGGLVSTVDDFLAFGEMLRNCGKLGDVRILSRPAVEVMTTNQLTNAQQQDASSFFIEPRGWGFGLSVVTGRNDLSMVPGRFGWEGGYGTSWASDPKEELTAILMTQLLFPQAAAIYQDFGTGVYQAIDD